MPRYARSERRALVDLFLAVGPDAPTLNTGWTTRDLAAHLVVRERRPDAALGILLRPLEAYGERVRRSVAAQPFPRLVELLQRPPWWSPVSNPLTDRLANTVEFFIHHEDVRRAQPEWQPRELPAGEQEALWRLVSPTGRLRLRSFPAAVLIAAPDHGEVRTGAGGEQLRLVGPPGELALFLSGRQRVAQVQVEGPPGLAERLRSAKLAL
ncbi:MAG TPA: TIGR03085 family metal-binding protein [Micromonosporaceae bacterium]|nr:TIGR03085 family metal-binding protein [Micromonosporaceae bacterium]